MTDGTRIVLNRWSVFSIDPSTGLREAGHRHIKQFSCIEMHARDLRSGLVCVCVCVCVSVCVCVCVSVFLLPLPPSSQLSGFYKRLSGKYAQIKHQCC